MKRLAVVAVAAAVLGSAAMAGPLKTSSVAGDAKWLAHVDVEAAIRSDIGQFVLGEAKKKPGFDLARLAFKKIAGFDPLKDIRGITAYGKELGSGAVVIDGTADQQDLLDLVKTIKSHKELKYGKYVLHQWTDRRRGKTPVGCLYDKDTVVLADRVELLQNAIDVLDGKAYSMAKTGSLKILPAPAHGSLMIAAAAGLALPEKARAHGVLLQKITGAAVQISEAQGRLSLQVSLTTKAAEDAECIRQIVQGFVALGKLMKQHERFKALRDLGEKITVSGEGATARLDASMPTASVIKVLKHAAAKAKAAMSRRKGGGHGWERMMPGKPRKHPSADKGKKKTEQ